MGKSTYIVVTPFFPSPTSWRGAYCYDFVVALKKDRPELRVEVFVPGKGDDYEFDGVTVHRFGTLQLPSNILPFLFRRHNERSFLQAVARAGIRLEDVAVCHGHTANLTIYPLSIKTVNTNCKTLLHHHDLASFGLNLGILHKCALYNVWLFRKLRALHEAIDCHVFISEASRKSFLAAPDAEWTVYGDYRAQMKGPRFFRCRPAKIKASVVLHNGVETGVFKPSSARNTREKFTIGCIGNFGALKDQMTLLKAVEKLHSTATPTSAANRANYKLLFIGSGPERAKCEEYARVHGLDAEFRNEVRHEELPKFYHELDLFVLPSYFEGFGCVYTEAWACGVPFIACEGQGVEDLIAPEDRGKWLCKPQDAEDLARKIAAYVENRWEQRLNRPIAFDKTLPQFLETTGI